MKKVSKSFQISQVVFSLNMTYKTLLYYLFILQPAAKCEMPTNEYFKYKLQHITDFLLVKRRFVVTFKMWDFRERVV